MRQRVAMGKLAQQTTLTRCAHCNEVKRAHHVCDACGYYRGKQVKTIKAPKGAVVDA
jgi:ribosomal protein L32